MSKNSTRLSNTTGMSTFLEMNGQDCLCTMTGKSMFLLLNSACVIAVMGTVLDTASRDARRASRKKQRHSSLDRHEHGGHIERLKKRTASYVLDCSCRVQEGNSLPSSREFITKTVVRLDADRDSTASITTYMVVVPNVSCRIRVVRSRRPWVQRSSSSRELTETTGDIRQGSSSASLPIFGKLTAQGRGAGNNTLLDANSDDVTVRKLVGLRIVTELSRAEAFGVNGDEFTVLEHVDLGWNITAAYW